jgi:hypothetical protein
MLNRKQRRSIKGFKAEARHKLRIADMQVMVNDDVPVGFMIVSPEDADRLKKMVDQATAKANAKNAEQAIKQETNSESEGK